MCEPLSRTIKEEDLRELHGALAYMRGFIEGTGREVPAWVDLRIARVFPEYNPVFIAPKDI